MIRDYWIYQERPVTKPWALYVVREWERGEKEVTIDFTLYHEDIPNSCSSKSRVGLKYDNLSSYVDEILAEISEFTSIETQDKEQLEKELFYIITSK